MNSGIREGFFLRQQHVRERLLNLQKMGLAECAGPNAWLVRRDFEEVLRAMQRVSDRQKTLAAHGVVMSDERLIVTTLDYRNLKSVEGRVLVHGEEEAGREAGRTYLMLEGTDACIHHIYYTAELEEARNRGELRTNSFVRLRKLFVDGEPQMEIDDLGDSEAVLANRSHLRQTARALIKRGIIPQEDGWGGWLGRYQSVLRKTAMTEIERHGDDHHRAPDRGSTDRVNGKRIAQRDLTCRISQIAHGDGVARSDEWHRMARTVVDRQRALSVCEQRRRFKVERERSWVGDWSYRFFLPKRHGSKSNRVANLLNDLPGF